MIICDNLTCRRGERPLFSKLGFCLGPGGFLLLKGGNGSGKTTLIRTLAGLREPEEGSVTWKGGKVSRSADYRRELTYVGHHNAIKLECTVEENLRFWADYFDSHSMLPAALRYYDLGGREKVACWQLSSGWQRRVALARLLLSRAAVWLLDEPTNFLDQEAIALTAELIEARVQGGGIVIAASHTMGSSYPAHELWLRDFAPDDTPAAVEDDVPVSLEESAN